MPSGLQFDPKMTSKSRCQFYVFDLFGGLDTMAPQAQGPPECPTLEKTLKKSEKPGFWPPKTIPKSFQNAFKIDVPKNMQFFIDFCSMFFDLSFSTLQSSGIFMDVSFSSELSFPQHLC